MNVTTIFSYARWMSRTIIDSQKIPVFKADFCMVFSNKGLIYPLGYSEEITWVFQWLECEWNSRKYVLINAFECPKLLEWCTSGGLRTASPVALIIGTTINLSFDVVSL